MKVFTTDKQALDFIAGKIAAVAKREGSPLSDVERKMLYFSETDWTLPEMAEVSAEFDRDYDQNEYERRISGLISKVTANFDNAKPEDQENWDAAIEKLADGDRYLLVMMDMADSTAPSLGEFVPTLEVPTVRPPHDFLRLLFTALAIVFCIIGVVVLCTWLFGDQFWNGLGWALGQGWIRATVVLSVAILAVVRLGQHRAQKRRRAG